MCTSFVFNLDNSGCHIPSYGVSVNDRISCTIVVYTSDIHKRWGQTSGTDSLPKDKENRSSDGMS